MSRKKIPLFDKKWSKHYIKILDSEKVECFKDGLPKIAEQSIRDKANIDKRIAIFGDIVMNNDNDHISLMEKYLLSVSTIEKLNIRHGEKGGNSYSEKLKEASKHKIHDRSTNILCREYWIKRGFSEKEASQEICKIQGLNAKKHHDKRETYRDLNPLCIEYWIKKGFSESESLHYLNEHKKKSSKNFTFEGFVDRYGIDLAKEKWKEKCDRRLKTLLDNHGKFSFGKVRSEEADNFFADLIDTLVSEIGNLRVYGSLFSEKEYFLNDFINKRTYFYDLAIPEIKLIVEYNGLYWHPRNLDEWNQSEERYYAQKEKDDTKINLAVSKGWHVEIVWSDDDFKRKITEIIEIAKTRLHEHRKL